MNTVSPNSLANKHKQEIASLKRARRGRYLKFLVPLVVLVLLVSIATSRKAPSRTSGTTAYSWLQEFQDSQSEYVDWLLRHGTSTEVMLFQKVSGGLLDSGLKIAGPGTLYDSLSWFSAGYLNLHFAALRLTFVLVASIRFWIVVIAIGLIYGLRGVRAYSGDDLLGVTGNGRVYYSGIRVDLSAIGKDGVVEQLVPGLACPKRESVATTMGTPLGRVLQKWGVANETNVTLASILCAYPTVASYAPPPDENPGLGGFQGSVLLESVPRVLESALMLHEFYQKGSLTENPFGAEHSSGTTSNSISLADHVLGLQRSLHRVLTPAMRREVANFTREEIATLVLGYESGKVLGYSDESGRWVRKSSFIQLCARAVLHSIPQFGKEYRGSVRAKIRQALVYGSRFSVFGPVRFPTQLSESARAIRQWVEVLMALPHELEATANEVELVGVISEVFEAWERLFIGGVMSYDPKVTEGVHATSTGLFFLTVSHAVTLFRTIVTPETLARLEELVAAASQVQRIQLMSTDFSAEAPAGDDRGDIPAYRKIFAPLSVSEIKGLVDLHGLDARDLRDWSSLRIILNSRGWLARRVGNSSVPESSVVFAVLKGIPGQDAAKRIGLRGVVPFRGSRLEERWGRMWHSRFLLVDAASMAEGREEFDRRLAGFEDTVEDDSAMIGV